MQLQNKHIRMMVKIFSLAIENQIPQLKQKQEFKKYNVRPKFIWSLLGTQRRISGPEFQVNIL